MLYFFKERKLRERSEEYCRQLQAEVRTRSTSDFGSSSSLGLSSDASRLEIERLEVFKSNLTKSFDLILIFCCSCLDSIHRKT